jgi:cobalamin biosynthesis protein CbiD
LQRRSARIESSGGEAAAAAAAAAVLTTLTKTSQINNSKISPPGNYPIEIPPTQRVVGILETEQKVRFYFENNFESTY